MVGILTVSERVVVTSTAGSGHHSSMIKYRRLPRVGAMAILAVITTRDVIGRFAIFNNVVVATGTAAQNLQMVHTP